MHPPSISVDAPIRDDHSQQVPKQTGDESQAKQDYEEEIHEIHEQGHHGPTVVGAVKEAEEREKEGEQQPNDLVLAARGVR